jgi:ACS family pantothenate transporter-like MFS transporter
MGVFAAVKENRIGAVVISVFDWYRTFAFPEPDGWVRSDFPTTASHYPAEEKKLLRKLDLAILVFGCLSCK